MSELERLLHLERQRINTQDTQAKAWHESPFTPTSVVVGPPGGAFAQFVTEVKPLVPRGMWRKALVGRSPDGLTRVAWSVSRADDSDEGPGSAVLRRRAQYATRCKLFMGFGSTEYGGMLGFVVLADGRGGFCGDVAALRAVAARVIAARELPAPSHLEANYVDAAAWRYA